MEIWINPNCSKCQSALTILDAEQANYTVRYYLEQPPTAEELEAVLARLQLQPWDITRLDEPRAVELGVPSWPRDAAARARWIVALAANPILVQRPIITVDDATAVIARTPRAVLNALGSRPAPGTDAGGQTTT